MLAINCEDEQYEQMSLKMRKSDNVRVSKSISLTEEFPPPPAMSLLNCSTLFSRERCSRCSTTEQHYLIACRNCKKRLCCRCSHLEKICITCKLAYSHPESLVRRANYASWQDDGENSHICALSLSQSTHLQYFDPQVDNATNLRFIRKTCYALELFGREDLANSSQAATGLIKDVLLAFEGNIARVNLNIIFKDWVLSTACLKNMKMVNLADITLPPIQPELWCGSGALRFLYVLEIMANKPETQGVTSLKPLSNQRRPRGLELTLAMMIVSSLILLFLVDLYWIG